VSERLYERRVLQLLVERHAVVLTLLVADPWIAGIHSNHFFSV
jgi:hypothetical protein